MHSCATQIFFKRTQFIARPKRATSIYGACSSLFTLLRTNEENERARRDALRERTLLPTPGTCIIIAEVYLQRYIYRPPRIRNPWERYRAIRRSSRMNAGRAIAFKKGAKVAEHCSSRAREAAKSATPRALERRRDKYVANMRSANTPREIRLDHSLYGNTSDVLFSQIVLEIVSYQHISSEHEWVRMRVCGGKSYGQFRQSFVIIKRAAERGKRQSVAAARAATNAV